MPLPHKDIHYKMMLMTQHRGKWHVSKIPSTYVCRICSSIMLTMISDNQHSWQFDAIKIVMFDSLKKLLFDMHSSTSPFSNQIMDYKPSRSSNRLYMGRTCHIHGQVKEMYHVKILGKWPKSNQTPFLNAFCRTMWQFFSWFWVRSWSSYTK